MKEKKNRKKQNNTLLLPNVVAPFSWSNCRCILVASSHRSSLTGLVLFFLCFFFRFFLAKIVCKTEILLPDITNSCCHCRRHAFHRMDILTVILFVVRLYTLLALSKMNIDIVTVWDMICVHTRHGPQAATTTAQFQKWKTNERKYQ